MLGDFLDWLDRNMDNIIALTAVAVVFTLGSIVGGWLARILW